GLQELGYAEGQDYEIEYRYAEGDLTRQPVLVDELIRHKPSVLVTGAASGALAAKRVTSSIPIVYTGAVDPVSIGLATSIARPDENVTGIFADYASLLGKQLELGFELVPGAKRAGILFNVNNVTAVMLRRGAESAAQAMAVDLISAEIRSPADIDMAFQTFVREQVNVVVVSPDPTFLNERRHMAELAVAARLPVVYEEREHIEDGGLMSYGIDLRENWRRAAAFVDKILKGD